jgi:hypothetical protein
MGIVGEGLKQGASQQSLLGDWENNNFKSVVQLLLLSLLKKREEIMKDALLES